MKGGIFSMNDKTFGNYLRRIRNNRGLTLTELAKRSGISQPHLSHIENGKRRTPPPETLLNIAKALEIPYSSILHAAGHHQLATGQLHAEKKHSEEMHLIERRLQDNSTLGDVVKILREGHNLSIEDLSYRTNLPVEYLRKLESNEVSSVDQNTISNLAKGFDNPLFNSIEILLRAAGYPFSDSSGSSSDPQLESFIKQHQENLEIDRQAKEARESLSFTSDVLTNSEKEVLRDLAESLTRRRLENRERSVNNGNDPKEK